MKWALLLVVSCAFAAVPPFTDYYAREMWNKSTEEVNAMDPNSYTRSEHWSCASGNWGDGPQCNEWDKGFSPCWPSEMTVAASFDKDLVRRWSKELCLEFAVPNRGMLGPGMNLARYAWNGRLGEYLGGEDPFHTAQMVKAMLEGCRSVDSTPVQVAKHFVANEIESNRNAAISVVDERTLFEVYYQPFQAAIDGGVSSLMCSYNLVQCTTGLCTNRPMYACANKDILTTHLKQKMGFKGFVMSDWDATRCQGAVSWTPGCQGSQYVNKDFASDAGLDHEMPACISYSGGVTINAKDIAIRHKWAFSITERTWGAKGQQATCSLKQGLDCYGNDIRNQQNIDVDACCTLCSNTAGCTVFTVSWSICYLKSACTDQRQNQYATSGFVGSNPSPAPSPNPNPSPTPVPDVCPQVGSNNYNSPCKLDLADRIIANSSVLLKNTGGLLPIKDSVRSIALIGNQACASDPMAQSGGSGWNGFACNEVPKVNVHQGLTEILPGVSISCPGANGYNDKAASADLVIAVVAPQKTGEGSDRATLQLDGGDRDLINQHAGMNLVVVMNVPGPMITSTWDGSASAILVTWLPGQQNGKGIAQALRGVFHASGRLPFTFPKCITAGCSISDERSSVLLGDHYDKDSKNTYAEKALIGYRWYQARNLSVSFPFGFGLFAYGQSIPKYSQLRITTGLGFTVVEATLSNPGSADGFEVPQLYLSFPETTPGDSNAKPLWQLRGFEKLHIAAMTNTTVRFTLFIRDFSFWDDSPGASKWVCASGTFRICVGANSRDAIDPKLGACGSYPSPCG